MGKTIHRDDYTIMNRPTYIDDDDWDVIFKREKKNQRKMRKKERDDRE